MERERTGEFSEIIISSAELASQLIQDLWARAPNHATFGQIGFLDGRDTVADYIDHGELGCALHHLLYMIHEAAIDFPREHVERLHCIAERIGETNHYSQ